MRIILCFLFLAGAAMCTEAVCVHYFFGEEPSISSPLYASEAPREIQSEEIESRLKELTDKYPEFEQIYNDRALYPEELLKALCNNPEMVDYVKGYLDADGKVTGGLTRKELKTRMPLLLQWDPRWGYMDYGDGKMALTGCAPACLSMVAVSLTGNKRATPDAAAEFAEKNGYYVNGTGTKWSLMTEGCRSFGICGREISLNKSTVMHELENGHPIICAMRPGDFTTAGHFIVLADVQEGKIRVNDPNSRTRSRELWLYETLERQIKNLWTFTRL
ncbi:MAG: C39 family peptidase [Firmicutes bacterium]|nr:C39 family peptidase [Bacillota bacterium]